MKRISVFLTDEQLLKLLMRSDETGAAMSVLIRKAIDEYLKGQEV